MADEVDNCVRIYDTGSGAYQGNISDPNSLIDGPVHLLASGGMLYITSSGQGRRAVLSYDTTTGNTSLQAIVTNLDTPSGLTLDGNGNLYVASRLGQYINLYNYNATSGTFTASASNPIIGPTLLTDQPEFIFWVD